MTKVKGWNGDYTTQVVMLDTIIGPQPRLAPASFHFDKTARIAWSRLVHYCDEHEKKSVDSRTLKRDIVKLEAKIEALADILASSLGMAGFYWKMAGQDFARHYREVALA